MTNVRMTDPEVRETRFPVIVEAFSIRKGSGGAGRWTGGDGATRRIRFREPMAANILANRRKIAPKGLAGGAAAAPGRNWVERADENGRASCRERVWQDVEIQGVAVSVKTQNMSTNN